MKFSILLPLIIAIGLSTGMIAPSDPSSSSERSLNDISQIFRFDWWGSNESESELTATDASEENEFSEPSETAPTIKEEVIPTIPDDTHPSTAEDNEPLASDEEDLRDPSSDVITETPSPNGDQGNDSSSKDEETVSDPVEGSSKYVVYTGDAEGIDSYLDQVVRKGIFEVRFEGVYTVYKKITIPAGLKIVGGTFVTEPAFEGAMFSAQGDSVQLIGVTLKAPALDKVPSIFVENGAKTNSKDSNVMGLYSNGHEGITLVDCTTDKIIPAKINNGSGTIKNCTVKDCSMFIWATNCRMTVECNEVSICDTGLDYYYHVYYLNRDSKLNSRNNRIHIDTKVPYHDIYHLMTKGNKGAYWASGVVDGDIVTGNYQSIIDCHYADLTLKNCEFNNSNPGEWTEISNWGHVSYTYQNCTIDLRSAAIKEYEPHLDAKVVYNGCKIKKTTSLDRQRTYKDCKFEIELDGVPLLSNYSDVYNCEFTVSGSPTGIAIIPDANFSFDFVGNTIVFKNGNTCSYLMECMKFTGVCHDNAITGAKTTKWWNIDRGNTYSNTINGITAT